MLTSSSIKKKDLLMFLQGSNTDIVMITEIDSKNNKRTKFHWPCLHLEGYDTYINFNPEDENLGNKLVFAVQVYM